jgi:hypothetical protein
MCAERSTHISRYDTRAQSNQDHQDTCKGGALENSTTNSNEFAPENIPTNANEVHPKTSQLITPQPSAIQYAIYPTKAAKPEKSPDSCPVARVTDHVREECLVRTYPRGPEFNAIDDSVQVAASQLGVVGGARDQEVEG